MTDTPDYTEIQRLHSSLLSHCFFRISPGSANYLTGVRLLNPVNTSMFTLSYHIINCKNSSSTYQVKVLWSTPKVSKKIIISFSSHENNFLWHNLLMRAQCKSVLGLGLLVFNTGLNKLTWDLEKQWIRFYNKKIAIQKLYASTFSH